MATARRDILIEELDRSIWVAALGEDGRLADLEVDPAREEVRWGSIYWAKVARIDKSMDAAFIALDGTNIGLLHNADVRLRDRNGKIIKGGAKEIGKYIQPGQMIPVQARTAYIPREDDADRPSEDKNPRVTMNIALPGRYLIHTPLAGESRVSQRVRDKKLRQQLVAMLDTIGAPAGSGPDSAAESGAVTAVGQRGFIMRAAATDTQTEFLARESKILIDMWQQIQTHFEGESPSLIMLGPDAVQRTLSDQAGHMIGTIRISTMDHYRLAEEWCEIFAPDLMMRIEPVELPNGGDEFALFDFHDVIPQIESLLQPYALLPSGVALIIQETAALTAIDVNRGADQRSNLAINLDCAWEIGRQLVLRNLGGPIVIDFLKMNGKAEQQQILDRLESWFLANDPCTVQIHGFTGLGMVELSRQRRTPALLERYHSTLDN